jgi:hypothetical protein
MAHKIREVRIKAQEVIEELRTERPFQVSGFKSQVKRLRRKLFLPSPRSLSLIPLSAFA